jgi:hypothetical protein
MRYEYKVVPAPVRGEKAKGVKAPEGRFAFAVEHLLNDMGAQGWEFQRAETLPSEERAGLTSSVTVWRNVLVFRREVAAAARAEAPKLLESPERVSPMAGLGAAGLVRRPAAHQAAQAPDAGPKAPEEAPEAAVDTPAPKAAADMPSPAAAADTPAPKAAVQSEADVAAAQEHTPQGADWRPPEPTDVSDIEGDNGVEATRDVQRPLSFLQSRAARMRGENG